MNILKRIRKSYITKGLAMLMVISMLGEFIWPTAAMALTSGPSQPETMSFEPVETTDMVNLFTGDFTYNIPLMNVPGPNGGYPINLAYHASPGMDEEASWVGLGWNINAGAINRMVRGVPDDFDGDEVKETLSMKNSWTAGIGVAPCLEIFGGDGCKGGNDEVGLDGALNLSLNFRYNSYRGFGYSLDPSLALSGCDQNYDIGLSIDSDDGIGINAKIGLNRINKSTDHYKVSDFYGIGFSSRRGLNISANRKTTITSSFDIETELNGGMQETISTKEFDDNYDVISKYASKITANQSSTSNSGSLSFSESGHYPSTSTPLNNYRVNISLGTGYSTTGIFAKYTYSGSFDIQSLRNKGDEMKNKAYGYEHMYDNPSEKYAQLDFSRTNNSDVRKTSSNLAIPQLTHDVYGIQGQGIGGSFRAYRNQTGRIFDPLVRTINAGGYFNGEPAGDHYGWGAGGNIGYSAQKGWDHLNVDNDLQFSQPHHLWSPGVSVDTLMEEKVIYKIHGEKTTLQSNEFDFIGGEKAIHGSITGSGITGNYGHVLPTEGDNNFTPNRNNRAERIARNNLVHNITNQEIIDFHDDARNLDTLYNITYPNHNFLGEYEIFYYNWSTMDQSIKPHHYLDRYTRSGNPIEHHNAGYKVLDNSGSYYVYGLPVYNQNKIEKVFTINATMDNDEGSGVPIFENRKSIVPFEMVDGDVKFEHSNTHKFYNKKETPAYAYSYLLTSILGADYLDIDGNGPSDGDQGFWVKMDYVNYATHYKWRTPYKGVMYSQGSPSTLEDDKGSYQYGEKEVWYMSRMETETHIAIFELSERDDSHEAFSEFDDIGDGVGATSGLKLDKIRLYKKDDYLRDSENAIPIQSVHFFYNYSLCEGVANNPTGEGKLTLEKIWFTYEGNTRGAMNPYVFTYSESNPNYGYEKYDRWGNYKSEISTDGDLFTSELNQVLPYTNQYQQGAWGHEGDGSPIPLNEVNKTNFQNERNQAVSAWSLTQVELPSGGTIEIDYEADDYAYVQDKRATQMTYMTQVNDNTDHASQLYNRKGHEDGNYFIDPKQRRIYFKLEEPLLVTSYDEEGLSDKIYADYVNELKRDESGKRNLYFKTYSQLKGVAWDFVSGYLPLEDMTDNGLLQWEAEDAEPEVYSYTYAYGASDPLDIYADGDSYYTQGFVTVECAKNKLGNDFKEFHPIAIAAWQYIRSSASHLLADPGDFGTDDIADLDSNKKKAKKVKNLFSFIPELTKMFTGYRRYCFNHELAQWLLLDKSMIRLTTPDKKKFGGGARVKQIALSDNWDDFEDSEDSESYGVVYDYTLKDADTGKKYSSGVAQYEPMVGGDEIALRYPKYYPGRLPFHTDNNLFFEGPANESYMPAPVVGYSQVSVMSMNTANQIKQAELGALTEAETDRGVTGVNVYEFYTAKDFPVIVNSTPLGTENNTIKNWNVPLMIPFIATYKRNKIAASQGYKIELNDMHGKLKSLASYGLNNSYELMAQDEYISKTTYKYRSKKFVADVFGFEIEGANRLDNEVPTLSVDPITREYINGTKIVGVEYEFFTDQRHSKNANLSFGFNINIDNFWTNIGPLKIPSFWGTLNSSKSDVRTYVTNKIIHKSGILEEVVSENESYRSSVKSEMYDGISGRPLLTVTKNEFEDKVYSLSHPAHWEYEGMGHAYKNINLEFYAELSSISANNLFKSVVPTEALDKLVPGDEFIAKLREASSEDDDDYKNYKATFISKNHGAGASNAIIFIDKIDKNPGYTGNVEGYFMVYRSGRRNHYMTNAGTITSMTNPVDAINRTSEIKTYNALTGEVVIPSGQSITMTVQKLTNDVLGMGAVVFKDNWEVEQGTDENPYRVGQAGIWRPFKTYAYAGERSQTTTLGVKTPRIKDDGVMSNVPLFNWQVSDYERYQKDWQYSGEITRLNQFGFETENKDRLGIYSAALYGYNHAFVIGVGGNATYQELATQDFEMYDLATFGEGNILAEAKALEKEGNFFFHGATGAISTRDIIHSDKFKIVGGKVGVENYIIVEGEYDSDYWDDVDNIKLAISTSNNSGKQDLRMFTADVTSASSPTEYGVSEYTKVFFEVQHNSVTDADLAYLPTSNHFGGMATVNRTLNVSNIYAGGGANVSISSHAHTGKQSMRIADGNVHFKHGSTQLIPGKRYVLSYWVRKDDTNVHDYNLSTILQIHPLGESDNLIIGSETKTGRLVNGWQKIEVEFELDPTTYLENRAIETRFFLGGEVIYIDDIRISPKTGGIVTYVYNPENFRLVATLSANNYATFYYYDEQGSLYLTKQETEEGIVTISGNHSHSRFSSTE